MGAIIEEFKEMAVKVKGKTPNQRTEELLGPGDLSHVSKGDTWLRVRRSMVGSRTYT